jgi:carboxyl-terminal processing protease
MHSRALFSLVVLLWLLPGGWAMAEPARSPSVRLRSDVLQPRASTAADDSQVGSKIPAESAKPPAAEKKDEKDDVYELQRLLVDTLDQVERNYVRPVSRRKLVEAAIKGVLSELDPYSAYIGPDEMDHFRTTVESEFGGIGIQVNSRNNQLIILSPLVGTPAYRAGVLAGDRILEIDGKSAADMPLEEAVRRIKGKAGTSISLTIVHPAKTKGEMVTLIREAIHVETVMGDHRKADDTWDYFLDPERRIAYVRIAAFGRETAAELRNVMRQIEKEKLRGLILDLRFNPGGLLNAAVDVCDLFIAEGRIVSTSGRNSPERVWNAHKEGTFSGFPMVVLVNKYSASASEIVSACLQDHKRAVIVGERTWGKGSVQNVIPLDDSKKGDDADVHSALKLTTAGYRRPSGKNIDRMPNAKDADEWGVHPNKGFELTLNDRETVSLLEDRRNRDIVTPQKPALIANPPQTTAATPPPATASPAAPVKPGESPPVPPRTEPAKPDSKPADASKPDRVGDSKPQAAGAEKSGAVAFVDRQLQMAISYLIGELARAK